MKCKPVPGFEKEYVISREGKVFRRLEGGFRAISPAKNDDGYATVVLYIVGKPSFRYIHILVADTWGENPDGKGIVNHKDGDKSNDSADNLEYVDAGQNTRHAYSKGLATGPKGEINGKAKLTKKQAAAIKKSDESGADLAAKYDVTPASISLIRQGKRWNK